MAMFRYVPVWARLCQSLAMTANNHLISVFFGGFLSVAAPSALDAVDAQQRQFDRLAAAAQDQERPVRERARTELQRLLTHHDAGLRAQAYLLYGQLFSAQDHADAALIFGTNGRPNLPTGSTAYQYCTLGLAYRLISLKRSDEALTLAEEVHAAAPEASPRGVEAVLMLGLVAASTPSFELARAALTRAEWVINQGPEYAVAGYESAWLVALRLAVDRLDPDVETRIWLSSEQARGDGRWADALHDYQAYLDRWPTGPRSPAVEWAIGLCLARSGNPAAGTAHWQAFIARESKGAVSKSRVAWARRHRAHRRHRS